MLDASVSDAVGWLQWRQIAVRGLLPQVTWGGFLAVRVALVRASGSGGETADGVHRRSEDL